MTKIMLVEDDNNLREIYEARLAAEGYGIVSAQDGEAALALASKERPDLIITDVMMPKISGFEMLDILRNTEGLRDVKVIMLTALGQAEDNARAGALGADRYLVKSQVTLEDIVKAAHEVIEGPESGQADAVIPGLATEDASTTGSTSTTDSFVPAAQADTAAAATPQDGQPWVAAPDPSPAGPAPSATPAAASTPEPAAPSLSSEAADTTPQNPTDQPDQAAPAVQQQADTADTSPVVPPAPEPPADEATAARPEEAEQSAQAEQAAETASQEELNMRAQIDEFIGDDASVEIREKDHTPPEEPESEYEKDAQAPDMGELSVHTEPTADQPAAEGVQPEAAASPETPAGQTATPAPEASTADAAPAPPAPDAGTPQPVSPAPGYPSQQFELPSVEGAAIDPGSQPAPAQPTTQQGDAAVSSAINDMLAQTPNAPDSGYPSQPAVPAASGQPAAPQPPTSQGGSVNSRIVSPLNQASRPDINQLLAMEEAKTAASQASASQAAIPEDLQLPPNPSDTTQPEDPNSIAL